MAESDEGIGPVHNRRLTWKVWSEDKLRASIVRPGSIADIIRRSGFQVSMMNELERIECVRAAVAGDGDALQRLIVHYHGTLSAVVDNAMDATLRPHVAPDDILQDAYASAFKSVTSCAFESPGGFYKWIETIALNRVREVRRGLQRGVRDIRRRRAPGAGHGPGPCDRASSYVGLAERVTDPGSTPSRRARRAETVATVITSLARLTEDQREVIHLRFIKECDIADIATALGKSEDAVHMLCHRGLKRLRDILGAMTRTLSR